MPQMAPMMWMNMMMLLLFIYFIMIIIMYFKKIIYINKMIIFKPMYKMYDWLWY